MRSSPGVQERMVVGSGMQRATSARAWRKALLIEKWTDYASRDEMQVDPHDQEIVH